MWIHRVTALAIVMMFSTVLRVSVVPTVDRMVAPLDLETSPASDLMLQAKRPNHTVFTPGYAPTNGNASGFE